MQTMIIFTVTILFSIMAVSVYASSNGIIVGGEAYAQTDIKDFTIGSLVTQTGSLSESGKHRGAITSFAVEKFNEYLTDKGTTDWQLKAIIRDTATDADTALASAKDLHENHNINFISGPSISASVEKVQNYAIGKELSLISCCSIAPSIAEDDNVFRLAPNDSKHGPVIANVLYNNDIEVLIPVWINDPFGNGLAKSTSNIFTELGGVSEYTEQTDADALYTSGSDIMAYETCTDLNGDATGKDNPLCDGQFITLISDLNDVVLDQIKSHGSDKVAVLYVGFESLDFIKEAAKYPALRYIHWIGSDADTLKPALVSEDNAVVRDFLVDVNFRNCIFEGNPDSARYQSVTDEISRQYPGESPSTYVYSTYDTIWAIGLAVEAAGGPDTPFADIVAKIPDVVDSNTDGALGDILLDEQGDLAQANYAVYGIEPTGWERIGTYYTDDRFVQVWVDPIAAVDVGLLLDLTSTDAFNDPDYSVVYAVARHDFNENNPYAVNTHTVDIGTGALPALNELYFGSYDYFYRDSLRTVIDDTISDYDSNTNFDAINDQYTTTDYPFVYNKEGHVIAHGFSSEHITLLDSNGAITSGVDINTLQDSDILPEEIYRLFEGENSPEEIWWQYTFLNPDTNSDAIKRSLLVYHSESGLIVGAGYYPILNNDALHIPPLEAVINAANATYNLDNDWGVFASTYDKTTELFYPFAIHTNGTILMSAAHLDSAGDHIDNIDTDKTWIDILAEFDTTDTVWVQYTFDNPATGTEQTKRSLLKEDDRGFVLGSGYYPAETLQYFAGSTTSAHTAKIKDFVNTNDIILVSPVSTAVALAEPDNIFRLSPNDSNQDPVLIKHMKSDGIENLIIVHRDDVWSNGLVNSIVSDDSFSIDQDHIFTMNADFDSLVSDLNDTVQSLLDTADASTDNIGILYVGFDDNMVSLFHAIDSLHNADNVLSVKWYGTDGVADETTITDDEITGRIAADVGFAATLFYVEPNDINRSLSFRLGSIGVSHNVYSNSVYDSVHLLAGTISSDDNSFGIVKSALADINTAYNGALGQYKLNADGDLAEPNSYAVYDVVERLESFVWKISGGDVTLCGVSLQEPVLDFDTVDSNSLLSAEQTQTITNIGTIPIYKLDIFVDDWMSLPEGVTLNVPVTQVKVGDTIPWTYVSDGLTVSNEILGNNLVDIGDDMSITFKIDLENTNVILPTDLTMEQEIFYRAICR